MQALLLIVAALLGLVLFVGAALALFAGWTAKRIERTLPPSGGFVEIDGARVHYVERGEGPTLLLVHGLGGQLRNFTHSLTERLDGFHVVALDRPGSGYSDRQDDANARLTRQAAFVAAFIAAKKLDRPLLVGHSLGGAVALATALDHPRSISGLALLAPLTHQQTEIPPIFRGLAIASPTMRRLVGWTLAIPASLRNRDAVMAAIFGPNAPPRDFPTRGGGLLGLRPKSFYATSTDFMAINHDLPAQEVRYAELAMPVGILFGTGDRILDHRRHGEAMAGKIARLELELVDGLGHMVQISEPDRVALFLRKMAGKTFAPG
ncbi:MAG: alpha/beta fold hydrolase [Rhizobiaceae bacterium]|nr:alpha/beta fold hydrolase [Rhizobiaceae bacterium]